MSRWCVVQCMFIGVWCVLMRYATITQTPPHRSPTFWNPRLAVISLVSRLLTRNLWPYVVGFLITQLHCTSWGVGVWMVRGRGACRCFTNRALVCRPPGVLDLSSVPWFILTDPILFYVSVPSREIWGTIGLFHICPVHPVLYSSIGVKRLRPENILCKNVRMTNSGTVVVVCNLKYYTL